MTDSTFEVIPGSNDVISMKLLGLKCKDFKIYTGNSEMCEKKACP